MRLPASVAALLLSAALLTACAAPLSTGSHGSPAQSPSPSAPSPSASASAEPTSTADSADPSTWVISDRGIGPIALGAAFDEATSLLPDDALDDADRCDGVAWWTEGDHGYDLYLAGAQGGAGDAPVTVVATSAWTDPAASSGPRTAEGIGVGSSVDEVRRTYPDAVEVADSTSSDTIHLRVGSVFFTYRDVPVIAAVTVTADPMPPYELCG